LQRHNSFHHKSHNHKGKGIDDQGPTDDQTDLAGVEKKRMTLKISKSSRSSKSFKSNTDSSKHSELDQQSLLDDDLYKRDPGLLAVSETEDSEDTSSQDIKSNVNMGIIEEKEHEKQLEEDEEDIEEDQKEEEEEEDNTVPARMMTSGSESGSDIGDVIDDQDQDECDKWAALIIADVQIDDDDDDLSQRSRSPSIESNSSSSLSKLSSSPIGFWYVRPGSSKVPEVNDIDESWSPASTPVESPLLERAMLRYSSSLTSNGDTNTEGNEVFSSLALDAVVVDNEDIKDSQPPPMVKKSFGLVRSQSFAALSSRQSSVSAMTSSFSHTKKLGRVEEEHEQYHVYFLKFIDLLIERETRARSVEIGTY
jgi:hypothetical protein